MEWWRDTVAALYRDGIYARDTHDPTDNYLCALIHISMINHVDLMKTFDK